MAVFVQVFQPVLVFPELVLVLEQHFVNLVGFGLFCFDFELELANDLEIPSNIVLVAK